MPKRKLYSLETGTFTPALTFGGGVTGIAYSAQSGTYTKIDDIVFFTIRLVLTSKGSSTGSATITGLPETKATKGAAAIGNMQISNGASSIGDTHLLWNMATSGTTLSLIKAATSTMAAIADTDITDTTTMYLSGWYYA